MRAVAVLLCVAFTLACSHAPASTPSPLSFGDFVEQILKPLAAERAEEVLKQEKARIEAQRSRISLTAVAAATGAAIGAYSTVGLGTGVGAALGGAIGSAIDAKWEADRKHALAHAEAQRVSLQQRLLELFTERTALEESTYSFCAMGKHRRYEVRGTRFARLKDDPAVDCPLTVLPIYAEVTD